MATLPTYTFLPWLRQGLSNAIIQAETDANPAPRATIDVQVTLRAESIGAAIPDEMVPRRVQLHGPGDVLGIDRAAIVKTEPRHRITNHEPNTLAHIEFYDEDFPWRYTPARADAATHRHRPWIALVVLEEGEFTESPPKEKLPQSIDISDLAKLPVKEELWAWAHVHVNRNLGHSQSTIVNDDAATIVAKLTAVLAENRDLAYARLIAPRRLEPNKGYHAFVLPSFETGRVAGLGLDVGKVDDAMRGAWEAHANRAQLAPNSFPCYHRWYFRTGNAGDFEYLVRLLQAQPMDARVGRRDIDVQAPGSELKGIVGPAANGVLRLGGALKVPDQDLTDDQRAEAARFETWDQPRPHPFQRDLAAFINLGDDYAAQSALLANQQPQLPDPVGSLANGDPDPDPLVTPPLYGRWHALAQRLLVERDGSALPHTGNWVHVLNLDPRHRVTAGLGTKVVRDRQEDFVNAAWQQIGDVLEANRKLRQAQLGKAASLSWFTRHLETLQTAAPERLLTVAAPLTRRVVIGAETGAVTVRKQLAASAVPVSLLSAPMRRVLRPGGRLVGKLAPVGQAPATVVAGLLDRLESGSLATAQAPAVPTGAATLTQLSGRLEPNIPAWLRQLLRQHPRLPLFFLILGLLLALLGLLLGPLVAGGLLVLTLAGYRALRGWAAAAAAADSVLPGNETPAAVNAMPPDAAFVVQPFSTPFAATPAGTSDSAQAVRFKQALGAAFGLAGEARAANQPPLPVRLDLRATAATLLTSIDPARTIPQRFYKVVQLPQRIKDGLVGDFVEVMAYPRIDEPMYRPLADLGSELLLPNVGLIPTNSIGLLETNQRFIESYMVGLNHEFARELLWREYPTDQRGSYFRQFWDVSGYRNDDPTLNADQLREKLYDIPNLHRWDAASKLGEHDNRQPPAGQPRNEVVLTIRGELLKRYPTAEIYAHKADWQRTGGVIDKSRIRQPVKLEGADAENPPRDKVKTPLYEAKVEPDITFLGFDLTIEEAAGNPDADDAGWFFVIRERSGEPRFGLDVSRDGAPINAWSDLAWPDVTTEQSLLRLRAGMQSYQLTVPPPASEGPEELAQHLEDKQIAWNENSNAADVAYVLYQLPVMVAVHAAEMLPKR